MTQTVALVSGLVELILSFLLGILVAYTSFRVFNRITREMNEIEELKKNNIAVGILLCSLLISSALIIRQAVFPIISTLQNKLFGGINLMGMAILLGLTILYIAVAILVSIAAITISIKMFFRLTKEINELAEIGRNNIAIAITIGGVIIVMGIFLSHGVQSFLAAIIPDPMFGKIQVFGGPQ
jgi:uncharacterized membrane protein YjfL (UPF0719 family)